MLSLRSLLRRYGIRAAIIAECAALLLILTLTASGALGQGLIGQGSSTITCTSEGCSPPSDWVGVNPPIEPRPPQDSGWVKGGWTNDPAVLCRDGHPAPRRADVTYGNLPRCPRYDPHCPPHSYERDHICPLGLGCPDILSNLQYQSYLDGTAQAKDELERQAEAAYCRNPSPELLARLRGQFKRDTP